MDETFDALLLGLTRLDGVAQDPRFHPEGDALFHSLQVFSLACRATEEPVLRAAALLHDIGKGIPSADHAAAGAALLEGIARPEVCFLVAHHLDLLRAPAITRARMRGDASLASLESLRGWDLAGRKKDASVPDVERALGSLFEPGVAEVWLVDERVAEHVY